MKFERFIAVRYLTRRQGLFAFITTLIGVAGVSVGVAALITTLSVMNGFQTDIKDKVIGAQSHILVFGRMSEKTYRKNIAEIEKIPQTTVALTDEKDILFMNKLIDMLEDNDDVQNVYHNWEE